MEVTGGSKLASLVEVNSLCSWTIALEASIGIVQLDELYFQPEGLYFLL
ncbi:MAG: hypothetical protein IKP36_05725 [Bacteroidaceae bacterium]|nr:hypothetical protein [Bacteroidaceae bacterium]